MNRGTSADVGAVINKGELAPTHLVLRSKGLSLFDTPEHIFRALRDWRIYTGGVIYFGVNCALASISAFLPTIIQTFGYSAYQGLMDVSSSLIPHLFFQLTHSLNYSQCRHMQWLLLSSA
jgi:hypothetical protein